jgi:preprotein translocase subunit YajC
MKKFILLIVLLIASFTVLLSQSGQRTNSYDIETIYGVQNAVRGSMVITRSGNLVEIDKILVPLTLDTGRYRVTVTRRDSNLYEVNGQDIFIKTRYCYEFAIRQDVIIEITSWGGYSIGKIYF